MNRLLYLLSLSLLLTIGCSSDDELVQPAPETTIQEPNTPDEEENIEEENQEENDPPENPNPVGNSVGDVEFLNESLVQDSYVLVNDAKNNFVYLMDKNAEILHQYNLNGGDLGNDCSLLPNGKLLAMVESDDPQLLLGGFGGKIQILDKDGIVDWSFVYSTEDYIIHHDAEMLPNGNVLIMTWERISKEEATANGYSLNVDLFPDGLIEVNPVNDEIVWEWHAWDHLIQDVDQEKGNFGSISENPQLIDLNYNQMENGDITHGNGIAYDPVKDVIFLSANFYSEVWVIDHSTTTEEAAAHTGGNYGKGGDLIYRFGNPEAYKNSMGERLFFNNHYPNLLKGEDLGNILIYSNGPELEQSTVYELKLPDDFNLENDVDNEPNIIWSFTHPELYSPRVSGAEKMSNGNVLITEGDFGIWEVTQQKEVIWKFSGDGFFWRAYHFNKNDEELLPLGLE